MANLITTLRLGLVFVLIAFAYWLPPAWQLINAPLVILIFSLDGVDGYVARRRNEETLFGSVFDVAADRIVENVLWIALADLNLVPVWVAIVFITRGFLVDAIRSQGVTRGRTPFGIMQSALGRWLVSGRFMRFIYAFVKLLAFAWLFLVQPGSALLPNFWAEWSPLLQAVTWMLVGAAVLLCLLRGLPVVIEFATSEMGPVRRMGETRVESDPR